ncbi:hypothetical protein TRAPUB_8665 [Trametes pubescens]|uniref:Uncharacterized protein n=1 Tax=Trametes pubescens TaxID=154538 RepID=A0A1M2W4I1_TRAPU|nr:hypothetical protein TRAPUB_8665 [Trametes pubescens]
MQCTISVADSEHGMRIRRIKTAGAEKFNDKREWEAMTQAGIDDVRIERP